MSTTMIDDSIELKTDVSTVDPLATAAETAWLEYAKGTWSETDRRIFVEGFRRGVNWQQQRVKAQARYEDDYERRHGHGKEF